MTDIITVLNQVLGESAAKLSIEEISKFAEIVSHRHIKKNQSIINEHEQCENLFIVLKGAFRYHYQFEDKKETVIDFAFTGNVVSCLSNVLTKTPANCTVSALCDSEILQFSYFNLLDLFKNSHALESIGRMFLEKAYIWLDKNYRRLLIIDAKDRYLDLLVNNPQLLQDVPLKYLASYLNINQQHLSRIRKELFQ